MDASRSVPEPLRQIPNALTILRFLAIPLFVVLLAREQDGPSWAAGIVFALAGITEQLDGGAPRPPRGGPGAPLARRVELREGGGPARGPADDRRLRRPPGRLRSPAVDR